MGIFFCFPFIHSVGSSPAPLPPFLLHSSPAVPSSHPTTQRGFLFFCLALALSSIATLENLQRSKMFCATRVGEKQSTGMAALLWYKDPLHLDHEMRPPSVQALNEFKHLGRDVRAMPMMMAVREEKVLKVLSGLLALEEESLYFDDEVGVRTRLAFPSQVVTSNRTLLQIYKDKPKRVLGYEVPTFRGETVQFLRVDDTESIAEAWLGALIVSRSRITQVMMGFLVRPPNFSSRTARETGKARLSPASPTSRFVAYIPAPRPASIRLFLKNTGAIKPSANISLLESCFPLFDGYFNIHLADFRKNVDGSCHANARIDDFGGNKEGNHWICRCDYGVNPDEKLPDIGFPSEGDRVFVSFSLPTTPQNTVFEGNDRINTEGNGASREILRTVTSSSSLRGSRKVIFSRKTGAWVCLKTPIARKDVLLNETFWKESPF